MSGWAFLLVCTLVCCHGAYGMEAPTKEDKQGAHDDGVQEKPNLQLADKAVEVWGECGRPPGDDEELVLYDSPDSPYCYKVRLLLNILRVPYIRKYVSIRLQPIDTLKGARAVDKPEFVAMLPSRQVYHTVPLLVIRSKHDQQQPRCKIHDSRFILSWLVNTFPSRVIHPVPAEIHSDHPHKILEKEQRQALLQPGQRSTPVKPMKELATTEQWAWWDQKKMGMTVGNSRVLHQMGWLGKLVDWFNVGTWLGLSRGKQADFLQQGEAALAELNTHLHDSGQAYLTGDEPTVVDIMVYGYAGLMHESGLPAQTIARFQDLAQWLARIQQLPGYVAFSEMGCWQGRGAPGGSTMNIKFLEECQQDPTGVDVGGGGGGDVGVDKKKKKEKKESKKLVIGKEEQVDEKAVASNKKQPTKKTGSKSKNKDANEVD